MKFKNFTLLKLTICFIIGILGSHFLVIPLNILVPIFSVSLIAFTGFYFWYRNSNSSKTIWFSLLGFCNLFLLGAICYILSLHKTYNSHYSHHLKTETNTLIFKIEKRLKSNVYNHKYYAEVLSVNSTPTTGRILFQQKRDSSALFKTDNTFITNGLISSINGARNPHQFNYKNYLERQGVYHQLYARTKNVIALQQGETSYNGWSNDLIFKINKGLKKHAIGKDELAIINALLLGQKQDLTNELYNSYTNSGAIHILAVSGLHVGIILLILQFVLTPFFNFKRGVIYKTVLLIICLWSYAFLTGGSASVIRATTMFSLVAVAINMKRKTNIYNTLIASVLLILIFKPQFIFEVGFQLSYAAVFSIVTFQPLIVKLWSPKNKILSFYWQTFSVTLAAQFGILPISLFYFHQFPGLFWLSNLIIIPALPFILSLGILTVICILVKIPFDAIELLVRLLEFALSYMNKFLYWISSIEQFIFKDLYFNSHLVLSSSLLIIAIYKVWSIYNYKRFTFLLIAIIGLQLAFIGTNFLTNTNEFIVFHKSRQTNIGIKRGNHFSIYNADLKANYITTNYKVGSNIDAVLYDSIKPFYLINDKRIMVIDSTSIYDLKSFQPDIVVLTHSPKLNLERLIETLQPKQIIADGSNYKSYIKRWKETCRNKKGLFHTTEKGAFIYKF